MIYIFIILFGIILGSFFNVYASRRLAGESILRPPSHCDSCGRRLDKMQLIPIAGYLLQKGKCKFCGAEIPVEYTLFEILSGILSLYLFLFFPFPESLILFLTACFLIAMGKIDYKTGSVYFLDLMIISILLIIQGMIMQTGILKIGIHILLFFAAYFLLTGEKYMGTGDIALFILLTMNLSFYEGIGFFLLFSIIGGIVGVVLLLRGKKGKDEIPLIPIIALSYILFLPLNTPIYYFLRWNG